jgi:apolipoprotein N-acyltransferase
VNSFLKINFVLHVLHVLCGVGLALALPPLSQIWLVFIALPIIVVLNRDFATVSVSQRFVRGLSFGFGYFGFALHWIGYAFYVDAAEFLWMMPFAVGGLALFMASYWGVAFIAAGRMVKSQVPPWLALPISIAVIEWMRGFLLTGFPWAAPGLIADGMGGVLQTASLVGMPGLTLLILLWGTATGALMQRRLVSLLVILSLPLCYAWGEWRLSNAPPLPSQGPLIRLVQPNISQSDKWRSENATAIFEDLLSLSKSDGPESATVVIWPESAVSFLLDESQTALSRIAETLGPDQVLLTGAIRRTVVAPGSEKYYTSIEVIDTSGVVLDRYDKWRLVPGGEYLPFAWLLEPLGFRKVVNLPESFSAGTGPRVLDVPGIGLAGMLICYEAIFPHDLLPADVRPRLLVNVTNDGWFGASVGPYQHLAQVRMRAIEQGLPIARAANTGISAIIDPWGRYTAKTEMLLRGAIEARLPEITDPTLFSRGGVITIWALGLLIAVFIGFFQRFKRRVP